MKFPTEWEVIKIHVPNHQPAINNAMFTTYQPVQDFATIQSIKGMFRSQEAREMGDLYMYTVMYHDILKWLPILQPYLEDKSFTEFMAPNFLT